MDEDKRERLVVLDGASISRMAAMVQMAALMHTPPPSVEIRPPEPTPEGDIVGTFFAAKNGDELTMRVTGPRYRGKSRTYKPNGKRECERRMRQMARKIADGELTEKN